jgi:hypothetical protein
MGLIASIALCLPIIMLFTTKLTWYKSFPALFFYFLFVFTYTITKMGYIETNKVFLYYHGVTCNFLDTPLILSFLLYFSTTTGFRRKLQLVTVGFILFEVVVILLTGYNTRATTIVLAPGLILTLVIAALFFIHQVKLAVVYHKAVGKAVIISSLLFAYVGYAFVYAVFYVIKPVFKDDAHLVYFLITIVSSVAMAIGIFVEKARVKQLHEVKTTREELKAIYEEERTEKKTTAPREAVILNFDKNQWH